MGFLQMRESFAEINRGQTWDKLVVLETGKNLPTDVAPRLTDEERLMLEQMKNLPKGSFAHVIFRFDGKYFGFNDCTIELFQWNGSQWEFFSGSNISGSSCSNYLFFRNGEIFTFGGEGYWQSHSDLFQFGNDGSLKFVQVKNYPENFYGVLNFQQSEGLFSLIGNHWDERKNKQEVFFGGYFLDLKTKQWTIVQFEFNKQFEELFGRPTIQPNWTIGGFFETADYAGIEIGSPKLKSSFLIIDKRTLQLYVKKFYQSYLDTQFLKWIQTKGNTILIFPESELTPIEFDIKEIISKSIPVGRLSISDQKPEFAENQLNLEGIPLLLVGLNVILLAAIGGTIYYQKKQSTFVHEKERNPSHEIACWTKKLEEFQGLIISQETMDELLGIQGQKNPDIRKVSRSRAIKSINEHMMARIGKELILRVRDAEDKRVISYQIHHLNQVKMKLS